MVAGAAVPAQTAAVLTERRSVWAGQVTPVFCLPAPTPAVSARQEEVVVAAAAAAATPARHPTAAAAAAASTGLAAGSSWLTAAPTVPAAFSAPLILLSTLVSARVVKPVPAMALVVSAAAAAVFSA